MWMLFDTAGVGGWEGFSLHGFTLRASPAVTHGVSPPGTVGEHGGSLLFSTCPLCSALHPHPRLRMVCLRRGQRVRTQKNSALHIVYNLWTTFTHYDCHTESQQSSVSHATAPVAEYLTPPAEAHHT